MELSNGLFASAMNKSSKENTEEMGKRRKTYTY